MLLESGSWLRRRRDRRKPCLIHQTKKNWMRSPPHMALLPRGGPIQVATSRVFVPRGVISSPATGHLPNGKEDITDWPPVNSHWSNGHYTRIFKSVNHRSQAIQPPVNGLRTRGPRATVCSPEWHSHCRHADVMQHFSNPIITTNENIIIYAVLSFDEEKYVPDSQWSMIIWINYQSHFNSRINVKFGGNWLSGFWRIMILYM